MEFGSKYIYVEPNDSGFSGGANILPTPAPTPVKRGAPGPNYFLDTKIKR